MAQVGFTPILIYSSTTVSQAPAVGSLTNSTLGSELAINITDGKLFYKDNANAIQVIAWKVTPTTAGGTGLTSYTAGDMVYWASGTTFTKLAIGAAGYWMSSSGTAPQWNAPAALTKTDDTNVTLTLGGSASTALLNAASLTLGWTGQLAVTRGGTGLATVAQGDILYGSAANTLAALAKNTNATRYLSNTGATNNPAWAQVDLTNGVTGTLPIANGGTGNTTGAATAVTSNATTGLMEIVGPGAGTTRVMTIPNANFTAARTDAAQSFTGDQTLSTGNVIQGTAAKGINFTANTPAAGMTSQLLNWYEEGAYTPTVASTTGALTSYTASAAYTRIGRSVTVVANVTITNAGTGAGTLTITIPFTANASYNFSGSGRENALTGSQLQANISASGTVMNVVTYANATVIATNAVVRAVVTYFV